MYLLFISLVFSLALGPDVNLLSVQAADDELTSVPSNQTTIFSNVTTFSPGEESTAEGIAMSFPNPTTGRHVSMSENVKQTSEDTKMVSTLVPLITPESAAVTVSTVITTYHLSTSASHPESTSQLLQKEEIIMKNVFTTEAPQTPSPSPTVPHHPELTTKPPVFTSAPSSNEEETSDTSPTNTPTTMSMTMPRTTPMTTMISIITTTTTTTTNFTTPQKKTTPSPPEEKSSTTTSSSGIIGAGSSKDTEDSKPKWLVIGIIALVIFCIIITLCVIAVIFRRRKQSGKQHFGYANGQKRPKKKGTEDDVWAGPVKLGGGDCEAPDEGDALGEGKKTEGGEVTGLSTFATLEENGGVGRPGSPEVEKWEENEPLLFIDEEAKEKGKNVGKSEDTNAKDGAENSCTKEAELNGGETFCLTTAV